MSTVQEISLAEQHPFAYFRANYLSSGGNATWERDNESTRDLLCLTGEGACVPLSAIEQWTDEECMQAEHWAGAAHLCASDNDDVFVPTIPQHVKQWDNEENRDRVYRESAEFWKGLT